MPDFLIRGLDAKVVETLKERARRQSRSLQAEIRGILELAAQESRSGEAFWAYADAMQEQLAGRQFSDSAALIREDRER
jgi:plasmid stability protein